MSPASDLLTIGRLAVDWQVDSPLSTRDRARLDTWGTALLGGPLASDLGSIPGARHEHICVRQVTVPPVNCQWSSVDGEIVSHWSRAIQQAVRRASSPGRSDVVRYASRYQAQVDLILSLLDGDDSRAWAWDLMDLWVSTPAAHRTAVRQTVRECLSDSPGALVPMMVAVAGRGGLGRLVEWLGPYVVEAMADAAWTVAGGNRGATNRAPDSGRGALGDDVAAGQLTELVARRSIIWSAALRASLINDPGPAAAGSTAGSPGHPVGGSDVLCLARLAVLEVEPSTAPLPVGERAVATLAEMGRSSAPDRPVPAQGGERPELTRTGRAEWPLDPEDPGPAKNLDDRPDGPNTVPTRGRPAAAPGHGSHETAAPASGVPAPVDGNGTGRGADHDGDPRLPRLDPTRGRPAAAPGRDSHGTAPASGVSAPVDGTGRGADGEVDPVPPRVARTSCWAGLLFLLTSLERNGFTTRRADSRDGLGFGLRRSLYLLGHELIRRTRADVVAAEPDDPGVLAFCGLPFDAELPAADRWAPPWADAEVGHVLGELRRRLQGSPLGTVGDRELLRTVVARRAHLKVEPGWIDVGLDHDSVDIDVRRAGLDLDPGFLPWLGVVVRFCYA